MLAKIKNHIKSITAIGLLLAATTGFLKMLSDEAMDWALMLKPKPTENHLHLDRNGNEIPELPRVDLRLDSLMIAANKINNEIKIAKARGAK